MISPTQKITFETTPVPFPSSISISRSSMSIKHSSRRVCSLPGSNPISVVSLRFDSFKSNTRKRYDLYGFCFQNLHQDKITESKHGSSQITKNYPSFYLLTTCLIPICNLVTAIILKQTFYSKWVVPPRVWNIVNCGQNSSMIQLIAAFRYFANTKAGSYFKW